MFPVARFCRVFVYATGSSSRRFWVPVFSWPVSLSLPLRLLLLLFWGPARVPLLCFSLLLGRTWSTNEDRSGLACVFFFLLSSALSAWVGRPPPLFSRLLPSLSCFLFLALSLFLACAQTQSSLWGIAPGVAPRSAVVVLLNRGMPFRVWNFQGVAPSIVVGVCLQPALTSPCLLIT